VPRADSSGIKDVTSSDKLDNKLSDKLAPTDPELAEVVEAWPSLPQAMRSGFVAMVRAFTGKAGG
jgi:hypothetical protein